MRVTFMPAASLVLAAAAVAGSATLLVRFASWERPAPPRLSFQSPVDLPAAVEADPPPPPPPPGPRRLPVAGSAGAVVVLEPDGSSYLESGDGPPIPLADAADPVAPTVDEALVAKLAARLEAAPRAAGRLVVLEKGVVEVPRDAVVTYLGEDRLVVHAPDGASTTYHVDGRIVARGRSARVLPPTPTGSAP